MSKILLLCAAGMSTSLLVSKMQKSAEALGVEASIEAHPFSELETYAPEADIILLGPQVRFHLEKVRALYPDKPSEVIAMQDYGMMNGEKVLKMALERIQDR